VFSVRGHAFSGGAWRRFMCDPTVGREVKRRHGAVGGCCGRRAPWRVDLPWEEDKQRAASAGGRLSAAVKQRASGCLTAAGGKGEGAGEGSARSGGDESCGWVDDGRRPKGHARACLARFGQGA
jgi:hypothetical protein